MAFENLRGRIAVAGVGYTPQGKVEGRTAVSFHCEAIRNALEDAGIEKTDVDALLLYRHFDPVGGDQDVTAFTVAEQLGIRPAVLSQETYCTRSWLYHSMGMLASGLAKYVVVSYGDNGRSGKRSWVKELSGGQASDELAAYGDLSTMAKYAMLARRAMAAYGTGPEVWKKIAVAQRRWANLNPIAAMHSKVLDGETYLASEYVAEPLRMLDATPNCDGGRAIVLTTLERARGLRQVPVALRGFGSANPVPYAGGGREQRRQDRLPPGAGHGRRRSGGYRCLRAVRLLYLYGGEHAAGLRLLPPGGGAGVADSRSDRPRRRAAGEHLRRNAVGELFHGTDPTERGGNAAAGAVRRPSAGAAGGNQDAGADPVQRQRRRVPKSFDNGTGKGTIIVYAEFYSPRVTEDTRGFWNNCRKHALTVQRCAKCGRLRWPASWLCPDCLSEAVETAALPEEGTLYSFVVMRRPFRPELEDRTPYVVAEVDFEGGVRLVSNLVDCGGGELKCGQRVRLVWRDSESYTSPVFTPAGEKEA